jgi:hypothetical protein
MKPARMILLLSFLVGALTLAAACATPVSAPTAVAPTVPPAAATKAVVVTKAPGATAVPKPAGQAQEPTPIPFQCSTEKLQSTVFTVCDSQQINASALFGVSVPEQKSGTPVVADGVAFSEDDLAKLKGAAEKWGFTLDRVIASFQILDANSKTLLTSFNPSLSLQVQYTDADLSWMDKNKASLKLAFYDPTTDKWKVFSNAYTDEKQRMIYLDNVITWGDAFIVMGDCKADAGNTCGVKAYPKMTPTPPK